MGVTMTTNNSFYATTTTKIALKHSCTILLIYIIVFSQDQDKTNSKKNSERSPIIQTIHDSKKTSGMPLYFRPVKKTPKFPYNTDKSCKKKKPLTCPL